MRIEIRSLNERIDQSKREYIERRLRFALSRFGGRIRRVMVRLEDMNGPRGGLDKRCHIEVRMSGRSVLVVDVRDVELEPAISRAAARIARRVRDELATRRAQRQRGVSAGARLPAA
jgi:ribosome-associated translation inhibitor RaiA